MGSLHRWRTARADQDSAHVEGLAAGTGLLTGAIAERRAREAQVPPEPCPACGDLGDVSAVDLVVRRTVRTCVACRHQWAARAGAETGS
jgi:hypothetical protein